VYLEESFFIVIFNNLSQIKVYLPKKAPLIVIESV